MTPAFIANHLWQSTIAAGVAWLLTLAFRRHGAQIRYGLWLAASIKFLVPLALLVYAGGQFGWRQAGSPAAPPAAIIASAISQPFSNEMPFVEQMAPAVPRPASDSGSVVAILAGIWFAGFATLLAAWSIKWWRVAAIKRRGQSAAGGAVLEALRRLEIRSGARRSVPLVVIDSPLEPGVFGILKPVLLWPRHIERHLTGDQIDAVLAHELAHARRRDNLAAAAHMAVQAAFWFHPLVWMIGSRLVEERERSCDEDVVRMGSDPRIYAESILKTCQWCLEAPLACVAGVTASDLRSRVEQIMTSDRKKPTTAWARVLLATMAMVVVGVPITVGILNTPVSAHGAQGAEGAHAADGATGSSAARPAFDVTSVKPNKSGDGRIAMLPAPNGGWQAVNVTLGILIRIAFQLQDNQIVGGPKWLFEDRFDVLGSGNAPGAAPSPMPAKLQALLGDRFGLVTHTETRELPMFALALSGRDGRLGPNLRPSTATGCPEGPGSAVGNARPPQPMAPDRMQACAMMLGPGRLSSGHTTIAQLSANLSRLVGSIVADRTNLAGYYDVTLEYAPDPGLAGRGDLPPRPAGLAPPPTPDGPSIFAAVQEQLGLKLDSTKGPVEVLVIDRAEQPKEN